MLPRNIPENISKRFGNEKVQTYINKGWLSLIIELDDKIARLDPNYTLNQIKEKFGGLRYYYTISSDCSEKNEQIIRNLVDKYEQMAEGICDECGAEGLRHKHNGWITTKCPKHSGG